MRERLRAWLGWIPLTPAGILVGAGSLWAWWGYGLGRGDLVLRTLGSVGLVVLALSIVSTLTAALQLKWTLARRQRVAESLELEVGHAGPTGFDVPVSRLLPLVDAEITWRSPDVLHRMAVVRGRRSERVTPRRRGEHERIVRTIRVEDHLGLARVRFEATEHRHIRFVPSVGALKNIHVVQGLTGGDGMAHPEGPPSGDPMDIRHYGEGDPIRYVLWKVFAKSRTLVVRTPERAISPEQRTVAYLVAAEGDQAAAGAARVAIETCALGRTWQLGADGSTTAASDQPRALELIIRSAACSEEQSGAGLAGFIAQIDGPSRRAVVFVPPRPGPWMERVLSACAPEQVGGARLDFVICTDGIGTSKRRRSWLVRHATDDGPEKADPKALGEVLRGLAGAGRLMVLDRQTGELHPERHLTHLLRSAS